MRARKHILPGFGLSLGFTIFYLGLVIGVPLAALAIRAMEMSWGEFWTLATRPRALSAYGLTLGASLTAALVNALFGTITAWGLVRYSFPGKKVLDALVDAPFAMPTAVAGLTLAQLFSGQGWLGRFLTPLGVHGAYSRLGVVIALIFVGLPFVIRTLQPVLAELEREVEEAAATLGASAGRTFRAVLFPSLYPAILTGVALAFARAVGEYGSVIFISSNLPLKTEIAPLVIVSLLDEHDQRAAVAVAAVLLVISFLLLLGINLLERRANRFRAP